MEGNYVGVFLLGPGLGCVYDFIREGGNASGYLYCEPERRENNFNLSLNLARNGKSRGNIVLKQLGTLLGN